MKKYILPIVLAAMAMTGIAQETLYLIKGNTVVAKYGVDEVDYATFTLPAGVTDPSEDAGSVLTKKYISASPVYLGTEKESGLFQIQLSTRGIMEENPPLELLYLQISTPKVTDLKNITVADGTYTLGDPDDVVPFKFYAGIRMSEGGEDFAAGTVVVNRPDNSTTEYILATDGMFTIKSDGPQYTVEGMLKLENGNVLELSYSGPFVVSNQSDEQPPVDEVELPVSNLTADYTFRPIASEAYVTTYNNLFADVPNLDYHYIMLYEDANYENSLDIALVVDSDKYPGKILPKGKYPVFSRTDGSLSSVQTGTCPAFTVIGDVVVNYGCWLKLLGADSMITAPLVAGEVEILEDVTSWNNVRLRATLTDNAETPHTVTCEFSGSLVKL